MYASSYNGDGRERRGPTLKSRHHGVVRSVFQHHHVVDVDPVDEAIRRDKVWTGCLFKLYFLKNDRNRITKEIQRLQTSGGDASEMITAEEENDYLTGKTMAMAVGALGKVLSGLGITGNDMHDSVRRNNEGRKWSDKYYGVLIKAAGVQEEYKMFPTARCRQDLPEKTMMPVENTPSSNDDDDDDDDDDISG